MVEAVISRLHWLSVGLPVECVVLSMNVAERVSCVRVGERPARRRLERQTVLTDCATIVWFVRTQPVKKKRTTISTVAAAAHISPQELHIYNH